MLIRSPSPILPPRLPDEEAGKRKRRKTLGFPHLDRHEKKSDGGRKTKIEFPARPRYIGGYCSLSLEKNPLSLIRVGGKGK